jgi:outer membrane protein TolC
MEKINRWLKIAHGLGFAVLMLGSIPPAAQEPRAVTLDEALAAAKANNALLGAARLDVQAKEGQFRQARSFFVPSFDVTTGFLRTDNPTYVFMGKLGQQSFTMMDFAIDSLNHPAPYNNWQTRAQVAAPLFTGGKLSAAYRASKLGIEAARDTEGFAEASVAKATTEAFYGSILAARAVEVTGEAVKTADAHREQVEAMRREGMVLDSDFLRIQVYVADLKQQKASREADAQVARAYLAYAMGEEGDVEPRGEFVAPANELPTLLDAQQKAESQRGDLLAMRVQANQAGEGVKMARADFVPTVGAVAGWEWNTESWSRFGDNWMVGVQVKIPVFDGGGRSGRLQTAKAQEGQARQAALDLQQKVRVEVKDAWLRSRAAAERVAVTANAAAQAKENLRIVDLRYREGMASITDLLDADTALLAAELTRAQAAHDEIVARARLSWAMGEKENEPPSHQDHQGHQEN